MNARKSKSATVQQTYDSLALDYDQRWRRYVDATLNATLEGLSFRGDESLLDLPAGTGKLVGRLLEKWPDMEITGVDLSPRMLDQARAKPFAARAKWVQADVCCLPFDDASFDHALCVNSFHYFPSPLESIKELRRVLRPDGDLILVDWCDDYLTCKLCSLWLRWTDPAFYMTYSLSRCRSLLQQAGFDVVSARTFRTLRIWGLMRLVARKQKQREHPTS